MSYGQKSLYAIRIILHNMHTYTNTQNHTVNHPNQSAPKQQAGTNDS